VLVKPATVPRMQAEVRTLQLVPTSDTLPTDIAELLLPSTDRMTLDESRSADPRMDISMMLQSVDPAAVLAASPTVPTEC
jgi:hypothetical protein